MSDQRLHREEAIQTLSALRTQYEGKARHVAGLNEAATRLLIVDEVLGALGWNKSEFNPESETGGGGFTDYLLSVDGEPRLVVEAKRTGKTFATSKTHTKSEYTLSYVRSAFGPPLTDVLEQAERYAREHGVPFAALTNGAEWILAQVIPFSGIAKEDPKVFFFGNLLNETGNYDLLWQLLSHEQVTSGAIYESFAQLNARQTEFAARPATAVLPSLSWATGTSSADANLDQFYYLFMDEMVDPGRRKMLEHCYVTNTRLDQYEGSLKRVLRDTAPGYLEAAKDIAPDDGRVLLHPHLGDQRGRVVLVAGSVGCGKSTFVTRVLVDGRKSGEVQCLVVDLIDDTDSPSSSIVSTLWDRVFDEWKKWEPESLHYESLRTLFHWEIQQLKQGPQAKVFDQDPSAFLAAEANKLQDLASEPKTFLSRCWRHYRKESRKGVLVFLDNVDRASEEFQKHTYGFAHLLARETGATVIVPMREMTFFRGREAGFLDIRSSDMVLHLQAPDPLQVLAKRVRYVLGQRLDEDHRYRQLKANDPDHANIESYRGYAEQLRTEVLQSGSAGAQIVQLVSAVAWHDTRSLLSAMRQIHTALSSTNGWSVSHAVGALMTDGSVSKPHIPNLYRAPYPVYACFFLKPRLLALLLYGLSTERVKQGVPFSTLLQLLRVYGYQDRWTRTAVEQLVQDRLLECLEAPAAAEYTKDYTTNENHSFRPSPLAVVLMEHLQKEVAYLALIGSDITFHSRTHYSTYVQTVQEVVAVLDGGTLESSGIDLLAESGAAMVVGRYLGAMFSAEQPLSELNACVPHVKPVEDRLRALLCELPGFSTEWRAPRSDPPGTFEQIELLARDLPKRPLVAPQKRIREATSPGSSLVGPVFWALLETRCRGQNHTSGAEICRLLNEHVFSDQERKEPTNISRALRNPVLRDQPWLSVTGKPRAWRYSLKSGWEREWQRIFGEAPPVTAP